MTNFFLTIGAFLIIFIGTEILIQKYKVNGEITRKIAHILSGLIVFCMPYYLSKTEIIIISLSFVVLLLFTKSFGLIKSIHAVGRKTLGEIYFPMGVILSAIIFLPHNMLAFQFGILIMAIADAMAALIGTSWGRHSFPVLKGKKSIEGSVSFFITSVIIWWFFHKQADYALLLIPFLLTCIEFFLLFGLDNLVLPAAAAYLFTLFQ